jgi:hypothetical protein
MGSPSSRSLNRKSPIFHGGLRGSMIWRIVIALRPEPFPIKSMTATRIREKDGTHGHSEVSGRESTPGRFALNEALNCRAIVSL